MVRKKSDITDQPTADASSKKTPPENSRKKKKTVVPPRDTADFHIVGMGGSAGGLKLNQSMMDARDFAESIINTVREPLLVLDRDLRVVSANSSFYKKFRVTPEETASKRIYDLGNKQWDIPKLRELLETIIPENSSFEDFEVKHDFPGIGTKKMLLNARKVAGRAEEKTLILLAMEEVG